MMAGYDGEVEKGVAKRGELPVDEAQTRSAKYILRHGIVMAQHRFPLVTGCRFQALIGFSRSSARPGAANKRSVMVNRPGQVQRRQSGWWTSCFVQAPKKFSHFAQQPWFAHIVSRAGATGKLPGYEYSAADIRINEFRA